MWNQIPNKIIRHHNSPKQINRILRANKTREESSKHQIIKVNQVLQIPQIQPAQIPQIQHRIIPLAIPPVIPQAIHPVIHHLLIQLQITQHIIQLYHLEFIDSYKMLYIFKMIQ